MNLNELVYEAWECPQTIDIEEEVVGLIEVSEEFSEGVISKIINRVYNVSDRYRCDSRDWIEKVDAIINSFDEEQNEG